MRPIVSKTKIQSPEVRATQQAKARRHIRRDAYIDMLYVQAVAEMLPHIRADLDARRAEHFIH